jgi:Ca2+-binding EF-hand superfamily protein
MFSPKELTQLRNEFADLDTNGDGVISPNDLQSALEHLNFANVPKVQFSVS